MLFLGGLAVSATCLVVAIVVVGLSFAVAVLEIWSLFLPIKCAALVSW
jgi:hypothetical protein